MRKSKYSQFLKLVMYIDCLQICYNLEHRTQAFAEALGKKLKGLVPERGGGASRAVLDKTVACHSPEIYACSVQDANIFQYFSNDHDDYNFSRWASKERMGALSYPSFP